MNTKHTSSASREQYRSTFVATLIELFPNASTSMTCSRAEIAATMAALNMTAWPTWITNNRVERGKYSLVDIVKETPAKQIAMPIADDATNVAQKPDLNTVAAMIPLLDPNYVPFGNHRDVERIVKSKIFYPTYITGPTGNGKSTMIEQVCAQQKRSMIRVNMNAMTDEEQLIGSKTLVDGNIEIVEGPVLIAMRTGAILLIDECDSMTAAASFCLFSVLEGKPFYFKLKNEIITPAPGFNIFATANTKGKGSDDGRYIGTMVMNEAFLERFAVTFEQEYPDAKVERKIVLHLMEKYNCVDDAFANTLVKWADAIRKTFEDGGVDELITTRRLTHIVRAYSIFNAKTKAIQLCCNRFDATTRGAFIDLYEKMSTPDDSTTQS